MSFPLFLISSYSLISLFTLTAALWFLYIHMYSSNYFVFTICMKFFKHLYHIFKSFWAFNEAPRYIFVYFQRSFYYSIISKLQYSCSLLPQNHSVFWSSAFILLHIIFMILQSIFVIWLIKQCEADHTPLF